jgi:predicted amidohydrolase YtcJ
MVTQSKAFLLLTTIVVFLAASCTSTQVTAAPPTENITPPTEPAGQPTPEPTLEEAPVIPADIIFHNGVVLTMLDSPARAQALAIVGAKIAAVGTNEEMLALADDSTTLIDLQGRTLMPGFIDPHTHLFNDAGYLDTDLAGAQQLALSNGITTLANMFSPQDFVEQMRDFDQSGQLIVRTSLYLTLSDNCGNLTGDWWLNYPPTREPGERLRIGGLKAFADGGTCGPIAVSEPILPDYQTGELFFTQEEMNDLFAQADAHGYQLAVHAIGDLAVEQVLHAIGTVNEDGRNPLRHRIEHNSIVPLEVRPLYAQYDVVATLFGYQTVCDYREWTPFYQNLGEDLRGMLDDNPDVHFAWHGDDPWVGPISPLLELASMVTRAEPDGSGGFCEPPDWMADKTITVEEGLQMMTTEASYALFREEEVGSMAPGMYADVIILSGDPTAVDPMELWNLEVMSTMVGGEFVYCSDALADLCTIRADSNPSEDQATSDSGVNIRASASLPDSPLEGVLDGNMDGTAWVSGDFAPQWIEFDLGEVRSLSGLRLWVDQSPEGYTRHIIYGGNGPNPTQQLAVLEGETSWGQMLEVSGNWQVRYLRIETVESPSWVAWLEVEFLFD